MQPCTAHLSRPRAEPKIGTADELGTVNEPGADCTAGMAGSADGMGGESDGVRLDP